MEKIPLLQEKKPDVLYHASTNKNIEEFQPRAETVRDPNEGPVVFATLDKAFASMFLVPSNDSWSMIGDFNGVKVIVISDEAKYKALDKGGAIYSFSNKNFDNDPQKNTSKMEWTSKEPVKPENKEISKSAIETMLENGVQTYFVDKATFEKIKKSPDHGVGILKNLQSENQKTNKNIFLIPQE